MEVLTFLESGFKQFTANFPIRTPQDCKGRKIRIMPNLVLREQGIPAGVNQQFTALGTYSDGTSHDLTPLVAWTSSNTSAATVNSGGLATAIAPGTAVLIATTESNFFPYLLPYSLQVATNFLVIP